MSFLNIDQTPQELAELYGEKDYYDYLRSGPFREAFIRPIADIVDRLGEPCLDAGCGEACLADYVTVPYCGFDGSETAIDRARKRAPHARLYVTRFEAPSIWDIFPTVVFGGIMEVLVKPNARVPLLENYQKWYDVRHFIIYDLERMDTSEIEARYGKPIEEMHASADLPGLMEVKKHRKILVFKT